MRFNAGFIVAAGLMGGMLAAPAAVVAAPILDQSQTTDFGGSPGGFPTTTAWQGQTVSPTQGTLTSIDIFYGSNALASVTVEVYGQTADNGFSLAAPLGSSTNTIGSQDGNWFTNWYSFNFNNVDISSYTSAHGAGRLLFVVKSDTDIPNGEYRYLYGSTSDLYAGGVWKYTPNSGAAWPNVGGDQVSWDMAFRLYTTDAVPEPASIGLLFAGGAGLLRRRRRGAAR